VSRVRRKLAEAVDFAKLHGHELVDEALRPRRMPAASLTATWSRSSPTTTARR
jgi:hypothetical protein